MTLCCGFLMFKRVGILIWLESFAAAVKINWCYKKYRSLQPRKLFRH